MCPSPSRKPSTYETVDVPYAIDQEAQTPLDRSFEPSRDSDEPQDAIIVRSTPPLASIVLQRLLGWASQESYHPQNSCHSAREFDESEKMIDQASPDQVLQRSAILSAQSAPGSNVALSTKPKRIAMREASATNTMPPRSHPADRESEDDPDSDQAIIRRSALAAAITTWFLLQPFIFLLVLVYFRPQVVSSRTPSRDT